MLHFLKRPRADARKGQFVSFEGKPKESASAKLKKINWQECDANEIVRQIADKLDQTDSTLQTSTCFPPDDHEVHTDFGQDTRDYRDESTHKANSVRTVANKDGHSGTEEETSEDFKDGSTEHPLWLKRPMFADICGNHALVNAERQWGNPDLSPLKRSRELDEIAKWQADNMAKASRAYHSDPREICSRLVTQPEHRLGENVAQGENLRELHGIMKQHSANYANMMDERYSEMGMATAKSANGDWFLCQIFRG